MPIHYDTIEDGQNKKSHLLFSFLVRIVLFLHFVGGIYLSKNIITSFGKSILQVPDTGMRVLDNTRPFLRSSIVSFWITPARSKERKYHIFRQYWYTKNVPVFTNTGTFQYLGPQVYFFPSFHWFHLNNYTPYEKKMIQSKKPNSSRGVRHARKFRLRTDASRDTRCSRVLNTQLPRV